METRGSREAAAPDRSLLDHLRVLYERRWAIYASAGLVLILVALATFGMKPIYKATAILQIEKDNPNILSFQDIFSIDSRDELFYQTQYRLIQSRNVARRVLERSGGVLDPAPQAAPATVPRLVMTLKRFLGRGTVAGAAADPESRRIDAFLARIRVEPYRNSRLVAISFTDEDPKTAAATANAIASAYIDFIQEAKYSATEEAAGFLARQIQSLKEEIESSERSLQSYGSQNQIVSLNQGEDITARKLSDFNASFTAAQTDRIRKETRFMSLKEMPLDSITEIVQNPLIRELKVKYAEIERTYSQKGKTYKPEWPEMARLRSEMDQARERLEAESQELQAKLLKAARADYQEGLQQEKSMGAALEAQKAEAVRVNRDSIEYGNLKMEVENKRNLLKTLLERQSETGLSARLKGLKSSNVMMVDRAEVPAFPWRPRVKMNLLMGLLLGLGMGMAMAFFLDHLDRSIKSPEDLDARVGLPALGIIPAFAHAGQPYGQAGEGVSAATGPRPGPREVNGTSEIVVLARPHSTVAEAYRGLRTSLLLSSAEKAPRSLLITSTQPYEGKTVTAVNTAVALVQAGKKVLLLDCDLRKPRLHKTLGLSSAKGLTSCLTGNAELAETIIRTRVEGLDLLPSGAIPPNPSELLASRAFDRLLGRLVTESGYDHVIVDSPPALTVTDALILASKVDGVVLVVGASRVPREAVRLAAESLRRSKGNILGALLNNAEVPAGGSYRYGYVYGAGYSSAHVGEREGGQASAVREGWSAHLPRLRGILSGVHVRGGRRAL